MKEGAVSESLGGEAGPLGNCDVVSPRVGNSRDDYPPFVAVDKFSLLPVLRAMPCRPPKIFRPIPGRYTNHQICR